MQVFGQVYYVGIEGNYLGVNVVQVGYDVVDYVSVYDIFGY